VIFTTSASSAGGGVADGLGVCAKENSAEQKRTERIAKRCFIFITNTDLGEEKRIGCNHLTQ
jgi:hypothetical protein